MIGLVNLLEILVLRSKIKNNLERSSSSSAGHRAPNSIIDGLADIEAIIGDKGIPANLLAPHSLHKKNGELFQISEELRKLFGIDSEEIFATKLLSHIHVQDRVLFAHTISTVCETGKQSKIECRIVENGLFHEQARPDWVEVQISPIKEAQSGELIAIASFKDISAQKLSERVLELEKASAEKESKAKNSFLANTSHELRTPLNAILGFSDLLTSDLSSVFDEEKRNEYNCLINQSAKHLLSVVNGILDMSKIEAGKYEIYAESFDLSHCVQSTVSMMDGYAKSESVGLHLIGAEELPNIVADERAIKQVLINLISNAIKFSSNKGEVTVSAKRGARNVELIIEDHGIGISSEHIEKLGEPFFQADSNYNRNFEGTGLGLSLVKGLLELHEGTIKFQSNPGFGTKVTVKLPIHGTKGRRVPASDATEKVSSIFSKDENRKDFNIARSAIK